MMTTFHRVEATITADPVKQSRTFVAPTKGGYLSSIVRASDVSTVPTSVLSLPTYKSPQFNGRFFVK